MSQTTQKVSGTMIDGVLKCRDSSGREVTIGGDSAPRATDVLLMAVAGCASATLNALLERDGLKANRIDVTVEGMRSEDRPRRFVEVKVTFTVDCPRLSPEAMDKYMVVTERACPVIQSLNATAKLEYHLT